MILFIHRSKFKSASTLNRHRESHAPVKKPIKKLKIKIIDGSCVISGVDSPAQRNQESGDGSPANQMQGKAENGDAHSHMADTDSLLVGVSSHAPGGDSDKPASEYMVEISTVDEGNALDTHSDDVMPETVISSENTVMISNQDGVMTFSGSVTNDHHTPHSAEHVAPAWEQADVVCDHSGESRMHTAIRSAHSVENHADIEHSFDSYAQHGLKLPVLLPAEPPPSEQSADFAVEEPMDTQKVIVAPIRENSSRMTQLSDLSQLDEIRTLKEGEIFAESVRNFPKEEISFDENVGTIVVSGTRTGQPGGIFVSSEGEICKTPVGSRIRTSTGEGGKANGIGVDDN